MNKTASCLAKGKDNDFTFEGKSVNLSIVRIVLTIDD